MKITQLPDVLDVNKILDRRMKELNYRCPFCGELDKYNIICYSTTEFRNYSGKWYRFWEKIHDMKKYKYKCLKCGGEWESDWFPQDIKVLKNED